MTSAIESRPQGPSCAFRSLRHSKSGSPEDTKIEQPLYTEPRSASEWADLLKGGFRSLHEPAVFVMPEHVIQYGLKAPRRRHADEESSRLAFEIAGLLYPALSDSGLSQVIKYEKDIIALRHLLVPIKELRAQKAMMEAQKRKDQMRARVRSQGPWDEINDALPLTGVDSLPMPVEISDKESLRPLFEHLSLDNGQENVPKDPGFAPHVRPIADRETWYGVDVNIWEKGMLYADGRMDLCKKVLGPPNIPDLMKALSTNTSVKQCLLGNNIIGPVGARAIAEFCKSHPEKIETWYLAGNCIDGAGLSKLVGSWLGSKVITNIWLKRNPLGPSSAQHLAALIKQTPNLRTLDLDQTELGDSGVAELFQEISSTPRLPLRNIYLNGTGISTDACKSIASFLASPHCALESLYMSLNPVGDVGALALAEGLRQNESLKRLAISSCGIKTIGASTVLRALNGKSNVMSLRMGQHFATQDLNMRYNYLEDGTSDSIVALLRHPDCKLKMLDFGTTALSIPTLETITKAAASGRSSIAIFIATSIHGKVSKETQDALQSRLIKNVAAQYDGLTYADFQAGDARWLMSPKDVRLIDSGYRNHDAGLARRGKLWLKKHWEDGAEQVQAVMNADWVDDAALSD